MTTPGKRDKPTPADLRRRALVRSIPRLLLAAFLFGYLPFLVYRAACVEGVVEQKTLDEAFAPAPR